MAIKRFKNKIIVTVLMITLCLSIVSACKKGTSNETSKDATAVTPVSVNFESDDLESTWNDSEASKITLNENSITFDGEGATVSGNKITINKGGTYTVAGTLSDGQIIVNALDEENVRIILNDANLTNLTSSPINVIKSTKTIITLAEGTKNTITDGDSYDAVGSEDSDEPNAAVYSKSDLTINGTGALTVNGNYNSGITSKDELKIISGNITVNAVTDGIKGRDYIAIKDGDITINAKSDGMQSNNDEDTSKGFIYIEKGTMNITAQSDGIQAETQVLVKAGKINISTGGGSENSVVENKTQKSKITTQTTTDTESAKGIKAGVDITIDGGTININSSDDSIHSNDSMTVNNGSIKTSSGDDGIHSNKSMVLNGGDITIDKSYEGIESASIAINNGNVHVVSSDDGINIGGGNDKSSVNGTPGENNSDASEGINLTIKGGYIYVDAQGDGIDVNGSMTMTDGTVIVNGPTNNGNGALDYDGTFDMKGGFLVAAGSSGMALAPSTSSTQNSLNINTGAQSANSLIRIESESGEDILTFSPSKNYESVVISSPDIEKGSTYNVYAAGSATGSEKDGLYSKSTYTAGTKITSLKVTDTVTEYGVVAKQGPGGGGMQKDGERPTQGQMPADGERPAKGERPIDEDGVSSQPQ